MTGRGDTGLSKAPAHGVTETGRQEESHRNRVEGTDRNEGLKRREALQRQIERAQELYLGSDVSKECYLIIKENADSELTTFYVPELDDAAEAVKILADLKELWEAADAGQSNRLLLAVFHSVYVDLENREVMGFLSAHEVLQCPPPGNGLQKRRRSMAHPIWGIYTGWRRRGRLSPAFATGVILVDFKQPVSWASLRGEHIKHVRKSGTTSQKRFAHSLKINQRTLRRWEKGNTAPNSKNQRALVERSMHE